LPNQGVHNTDLPYGNTAGTWYDPELIVGRIVGDDAAELIIPLQASINVFKGEPGFSFNRWDALVVAGRGESVTTFEADAEAVQARLQDEFVLVDILKQKEEEEAGRDMAAVFEGAVTSRDVVFYVDHCGQTRWGDGSTVVNVRSFTETRIIFGSPKPFVFACCCRAGKYESGRASRDQDNIVQAFLQYGSAAYVGAVEDSYIDTNSEACPGFFEDWVNSGKSIGQSLKDLKRDLAGYMEDMWAAQYNLYGDPKYGGPETASLVASLPTVVMPPPSTLEVTIPDYEVTTIESQDYVRIPGGSLVLHPGQPKVPDYAVNVVFPAGYVVQEVTLAQRGGLVITTGLHIPNVTAEPAAPTLADAYAQGGSGWWPGEPFTWSVKMLPDGMSVLMVRMYPFYYNASTTDVSFYKNYTFDIRTVTSTVAIGALTTDKHAYAQGEVVTVGLWITSTSAAQDVVVSVAVESESSGEVVDGLLLRTLPDVASLSSFSNQWNSTGFALGYYAIQAELRDTNGDVLARGEKSFRVGIVSGEITTLTVTPTLFDIGTQVAVSSTFINTGTVPLTGTAVMQIQTEAGEIVQTFNHNYGNLSPDHALNFTDVWDATGITGGNYRVIAYVRYESTATEPAIATIKAKWPLYLPLIINFTFH
jgi:hypothetical protein